MYCKWSRRLLNADDVRGVLSFFRCLQDPGDIAALRTAFKVTMELSSRFNRICPEKYALIRGNGILKTYRRLFKITIYCSTY